MALLPVNIRTARAILPIFFAVALGFVLFYMYAVNMSIGSLLSGIPIINSKPASKDETPTPTHDPPRYKPTPTWVPPPVFDPLPLLAMSTAEPPPIPEYNVPRPDMHQEYGLDRAPPLYIGFTRQWPMLLQAVVSYITAGWPADNIYVVENTGAHNSNRQGKLSLQNPFYLNHTTLQRLGVHVVQTPVLLSFAQLQNFFMSQAYESDHRYYFYSHQDVVVFSFEDGPDNNQRPGDRPWQFYDKEDEVAAMFPNPARQPGYRTIYENCLRELNATLEMGERWGQRWFQYDHLALVNRDAMEAVGGYDPLIPYYNSDCDINGKLAMGGWTLRYRRVGLINDVSSVVTNLEAFYRNPSITPSFTDPNPLPPEQEAKILSDKAEKEAKEKAAQKEAARIAAEVSSEDGNAVSARRDGMMPTDPVEYFRILNKVGVDMGWHKYRDHDNVRNTWQSSQRGGFGEPFYYDPLGFGRAFWVLAEAGREVYRQKWGHRDCDIAEGTALKLGDQWRVEKDWGEKKEGE
ncbi:hypothetical protein B0T25DRAFT_359910 [Lasiosphaeria hispida]|uniref:Glycosyl transferase family 8 protein n=1 Tax=Lasiosphaeria hispida TaxID=260671 RepID=A0AAJ0H867_9PEZI|nr:hypothetical protein B0T25DRAFT_359910 [Lasiosphaeria hispida]